MHAVTLDQCNATRYNAGLMQAMAMRAGHANADHDNANHGNAGHGDAVHDNVCQQEDVSSLWGLRTLSEHLEIVDRSLITVSF